MRVTISITDEDVKDHINNLKAKNVNISSYITNLLREDIKDTGNIDKKEIEALVKKILNENKDISDDSQEDQSLKKDINNMFDSI